MRDSQSSADGPQITPRRAAASGIHYDIPAGVFELLLDRHMNYSSAYYADNDDLDAAQETKMTRIARAVELKPGSRILDAGCGWGGPALFFAERYGCHVTGINLSPIQRDYALAWAARRGLGDRLTVEVRNVLEMPYQNESFDQILFLESIIHMPEKDAIFARCRELLKPGGYLFIQESHYDRASNRPRYLADRGFQEVNHAFGDTGDLLSGGEMLCRLEEAGLTPLQLENISHHYIRTLTHWLNNFDRHAAAMHAISGHATLMLRRYLMIALATYRAGHTVCYQITARKPP
jgi:cyclopropane-fatty-acyl-phospholipid synthase